MTRDTQITTDTGGTYKEPQRLEKTKPVPTGYYGDSGFEVPDNPDPAFNPYVATYSNSLGLLGLLEDEEQQQQAPMMAARSAMPQMSARQDTQGTQGSGTSGPMENNLTIALLAFVAGLGLGLFLFD